MGLMPYAVDVQNEITTSIPAGTTVKTTNQDIAGASKRKPFALLAFTDALGGLGLAGTCPCSDYWNSIPLSWPLGAARSILAPTEMITAKLRTDTRMATARTKPPTSSARVAAKAEARPKQGAFSQTVSRALAILRSFNRDRRELGVTETSVNSLGCRRLSYSD